MSMTDEQKKLKVLDQYGYRQPYLGQALKNVGIKNYIYKGEPRTEEDFKANVRLIKDDDSETNDLSEFGVTWSQVDTEMKRLQTEFDNALYQRKRSVEYPDWGTQLDYIYHNGVDKWKTDIVDPVKQKYPKPE